MPEGWCWCKLEDIAQSNIGLTYKPADVTTDGTPVLRSNNIQNNKLCLDDVVRVSTEIRANQFISKGDLLICARNGSRRLVGKSALINSLDEQCSFGAFMAVCKSLYNEWLFYVLCSTYFSQYLDDSNSTTIYQVTQKMLLDLPVPFPPLKEQKRIATEIEKYINLIDLLEESKHDLDLTIFHAKSKILDLAIHGKLVPQDENDEPASELLKRINPKAIASCDNPHYEQIGFEMPSNWLISSLSDICDSINGLWTGKKPPFVRVGVIRNANFTKDFRLDYSKIEYIEVEEKSFEKRHLLNGDIIVEKSGGSDKNPVGRAILYEGVDKQFSYSNFTMVLRIRNHSCVYSKYLYYYLMAVYLRGDMRKFQTQTTGLHNLILDSYLSMPIYLPPFEGQKRISNKIDELFKSLKTIANTLK